MLRILVLCAALGITAAGCSSSSSETSASPEASVSTSTSPSTSSSTPAAVAKVKQLSVGESEDVEGGELVGSYDKKVVKLQSCPNGPCMTEFGPSVWRVTGKSAGTTTVSLKGEQTTTSYQFIVSEK